MQTIMLLSTLFTMNYTYPILPKTGRTIDFFIPKGYQIIYHKEGNLNDDKVKDAAVIIESKTEIDNLKETEHAQKPRILFILFGKLSGGYNLSVQSNESIMLSDDGGVFGDPLQELYIMGKTVCVDYYGGSNFKWSYTYKWRYQQKDWFLIGATHSTMDPLENKLETYDFNLSTGVAEQTVMPYLEEDEGKPTIKPKTKRFNPGKKPLYKLKDFKFGENMVYKDIFF